MKHLEDIQHIHMIGIGGIGMSGLARLYHHEGIMVTGSDRTESVITKKLAEEGVTVTYGQDLDTTIHDSVDLAVYSDAVAEDHSERVKARSLGIPEMQYFEALAEVANEYHLIAVAGTHGKTTTTAMLVDILEDAGLDPTAIVGSLRARTGSNFRAGKSKYFIVEADEYRRHFLYLKPHLAIITNIEFDHPDYFSGLGEVQSVFREFIAHLPGDGALVADQGEPNVAPVVDATLAQSTKVIDYRAHIDPTLTLKQPGLHNLKNAAAAIAAAATLGIDTEQARNTLQNYEGTWRRFQHKGEVNGAPVYDDYAHHPTEINATIQGVRERHPAARVVAIFQPHTYSRTQELFIDFARALAKADRIILAPIYAARETNACGVASEQLANEILKSNTNVRWFPNLHEIAAYVRNETTKDDVVVVMGAGDISTVADLLTKE